MAMLTVEDAGKKIADRYVVQSVSFEQQPLEQLAIAGETGSGKTTLMKMIGGYEQLGEGKVTFLNRDILGPLDKLLPGHPGIAYLSQHFELRNNYYVWEVLDYGNKLPAEQAAAIYEICRISHLLQRKTNQLSGGERQRIALAKQLVTIPKLLLLDEPFSNLDASHRAVVKQVLEDIGSKLQITCTMIAHDPVDILSWADTILVMQEGKMIQQGKPEDIYYNPVNGYCAALFGNYNLLTSEAANLFSSRFGANCIPANNIIRPEKFDISTDASQGVPAIINRNLFCGAYYLIEATVSNSLLKIYAEKPWPVSDDHIYLSLA